ncbi:MAG: hypothetical protein ACFFDX_01480 [Candidatus Odinarchaeota archaeon]
MKTGGILALIGGIISLFACFLLSFYQFGPYTYGWGTGLLLNAGYWIEAATIYGETLIIVAVIVFIIFIFGGVLQIIGIKSRATAIIGALFSILLAVFFILFLSGALAGWYDIAILAFTFTGPVGSVGPLPLHVGLGDFGLGVFVLLAGGVLSLVGGILPRD